jgi:DNA-binding NarL/FixJ family response regulator
MNTIRILLANNRPRIMREVMRQLIERQPDMEIVAEVFDLSALSRIAEETAADVIIVALEDSNALRRGRQLLAERPKMALLALAAKGDAAFIEQVRLGRREIAEPSEANILSAIRLGISTRDQA